MDKPQGFGGRTICIFLIYHPTSMKQLKAFILFFLISSTSFAQIIMPRHWSFRADQIKGNEYNLVFTMVIDKPWHGYSQKVDGDAPKPTLISIDKNADIELIGPTT